MAEKTPKPEDPLHAVEHERRREDETDREYTTPQRERELDKKAEPDRSRTPEAPAGPSVVPRPGE